MIKLRWFSTYDENGVNSEKELQYWSEELERWEGIRHCRVPEHKMEDYMDDPNVY